MIPSSPLTSRPAYFLYGAIVIVAAVIVGAVFVSPQISAKRQFAEYNEDSDNVALHGYDTVAYFTEGKLYLNTTEELRDAWRKAPKAYVVYADYNWENNRDQLRNNF